MYLACKYYLGTLFLRQLVERWDCCFTWSSEPGKGLAACIAKEAPSFLSYFKTLSVESNPGPPALQSSALPSKQSCRGYKRYTGR